MEALGFRIIREEENSITVEVPYSKPDITIQADLVEEIMRIDGLDNIEIPKTISISPAIDAGAERSAYREKVAEMLTGKGFSEIFTNSITNSAYYAEASLKKSVKLLNNLSAELDMLRPSLLETGLEAVAYNINRQNRDVLFFELGKTYSVSEKGFDEKEQLSIYVSGSPSSTGWRGGAAKQY